MAIKLKIHSFSKNENVFWLVVKNHSELINISVIDKVLSVKHRMAWFWKKCAVSMKRSYNGHRELTN